MVTGTRVVETILWCYGVLRPLEVYSVIYSSRPTHYLLAIFIFDTNKNRK